MLYTFCAPWEILLRAGSDCRHAANLEYYSKKLPKQALAIDVSNRQAQQALTELRAKH